jgi:xylulokinase
MTELKYILAHDIGTEMNKAAIVGTDAKIAGTASAEYNVSYPNLGWAEQDPEVYWEAIVKTTREVLAKTKIKPSEIGALVFDAMMASIVPVDKNGKALRPILLWLDTRASKQSDKFMTLFDPMELLRRPVIPPMSAKDQIPKIMWIKEKEPEIFAKTAKFVDVKDYMIYKCVGDFFVDWSCASVDGMFNMKTNTVEKEIVEKIGLTEEKLSKVVKTIDIVGNLTKEAAHELGLTENVQVVCGCGDVPAVGIGSGAIKNGNPHLYMGSSGWIALHTDKPLFDLSGVGTICSGDPNKLLLLGQMENAGSCLKWFKDELCESEKRTAEQSGKGVYQILDEEATKSPPGSKCLLFTPWMLGERCPFIDSKARGGFVNLALNHSKRDMIRSVMEGVAYNTRWVQDMFEVNLKQKIVALNGVGGGAKSSLWMQIFSDVLNKPIKQIHVLQDVGSVGAAMVASVALGVYKDFDSLEKIFKVRETYNPIEENVNTYNRMYDALKRVYKGLTPIHNILNK